MDSGSLLMLCAKRCFVFPQRERASRQTLCLVDQCSSCHLREARRNTRAPSVPVTLRPALVQGWPSSVAASASASSRPTAIKASAGHCKGSSLSLSSSMPAFVGHLFAEAFACWHWLLYTFLCSLVLRCQVHSKTVVIGSYNKCFHQLLIIVWWGVLLVILPVDAVSLCKYPL